MAWDGTSRKGDYYRYMSEYTVGTAKREAAQNAYLQYKSANDIAMMQLPPTHPLRLGLALNFSVFYYEILNAPDRACRLAKQAFGTISASITVRFGSVRTWVEWTACD